MERRSISIISRGLDGVGDHENSLKGENRRTRQYVAVVGHCSDPVLRCCSSGLDNQKAARSAGKSENEITSGDQTFRAACMCITGRNDIVVRVIKPKTARKVSVELRSMNYTLMN